MHKTNKLKQKLVYAIFFSMIFSPAILIGLVIMWFGMPSWISAIGFIVVLIGNILFMQQLFEKLGDKNYKGFLSDIDL